MNTNTKKWLRIAALLGAIAVILGAFGAHALKARLTEELLSSYRTGVEYQFYHVLALFGIAVTYNFSDNKWLGRAAWCFLIGIIGFSGSIYLLSCREILGLDALRPILGPITPIGGTFFIIGWVLLFIAGLGKKD